MKKIDLIGRVLQSINRPIVRQVPGREKGKPVVRDVTVSSMDELLSRAKSLLLQAASVSADVDGYASTTPGNGSPGGGKGGGRLMKIEGDFVPTTSTEAAALLGHRGGGDPLSRLGARAWSQLLVIESAVHQLERVLLDADHLQSTATVAEVRMCAIATSYSLPWDDEWSVAESRQPRLTDFAGVLADPLTERQLVCRYVYRFVHNHKRLPERAELLAHLETKARR